MFVDNAADARRFFCTTYAKAFGPGAAATVLTPLEAMVADILGRHPEYHELLANLDDALNANYPGDLHGNPFLHLSLHVALAEQVGADRPVGIKALHGKAMGASRDPHALEHAWLAVLAETVGTAQATGVPPDEVAYLARLSRLKG